MEKIGTRPEAAEVRPQEVMLRHSLCLFLNLSSSRPELRSADRPTSNNDTSASCLYRTARFLSPPPLRVKLPNAEDNALCREARPKQRRSGGTASSSGFHTKLMEVSPFSLVLN